MRRSRVKWLTVEKMEVALLVTVLATKQTLLELQAHKLIIDVATQWNRCLDMILCFLKCQAAVTVSLMSKV